MKKDATKAELLALEKVFAREIGGTLPFQSKAKMYQSLREKGWVAPMEVRIGLARISGWTLTHLGRLLYCESCGQP